MPGITLDWDWTSNPTLTDQAEGVDLTWDRSGYSCVENDSGFLRVVSGDDPRFFGANIVTNWAQQTEDLASWANNTNVSVVDDADSVVHDGQTINLSEITDDATSGLHICRLANQLNEVFTVMDRDLIYSCYVKGGTHRYIHMAHGPWTNSTRVNIFDTVTGTWVYTGTIGLSGHGAIDLGGGYYRIYFRHDKDGALSTAYDEQLIGHSNGAGYLDAVYSGTGDTVYAGGFMIEEVDSTQTTPSKYHSVGTTGADTGFSKYYDTCSYALTEPAATNEHPYSEDPESWALLSNITTTRRSSVSPSGHQDATICEESAAAGYLVEMQALPLLTDSTDYIWSIYAKSGGTDFLTLNLRTKSGDQGSVNYDLANGTVNEIDVSNILDTGIEAAGAAGWYRCWIKFNAGTGASTEWLRYYPVHNSTAVQGDGTGSVHLWGAQLETAAQLVKPSSYFPNRATGTSTRTRDWLYRIVTSDTWYPGNAAGTKMSFWHDFEQDYFDDGDLIPLTYLYEQGTYAILMANDLTGARTGQGRCTMRDGGGQGLIEGGLSDFATNVRSRYAVNITSGVEAQLWVDGTKLDEEVTNINPPGMDTFTPRYLILTQNQAGTDATQRPTKHYRWSWFNEYLSADQAEALTTSGEMPSFERRVKLIRTKTASLLRGLIRNLFN